ncbi:DUF3159 domain-containing protein [Microcella flavibacter]|uniref:DUF3159 domain-containing protein n=1 Tax=Microcella flavibacter TaxID=1804990 RepID=UPI001456B4A6|nr:DUF3159 domain-containing protein [Microcella flavibacter]
MSPEPRPEEGPRDEAPRPASDPRTADGAADPAPSVTDALSEAARKSAFARVAPGERPTAADLWAAVGGVRGLVESLLPGFLFLVVFTITGEVAPSVLVPLGMAVVFVLVRAVTRTPILPAVVGLIGIAISAGLALATGRAEENFLLGLIINAVWLTALLVSLAVRRPLIGVITALLTGDAGWRQDPAKRSVLTVTTWLWVGMFSLRLGVQVPLYFGEQAGALAATRLLMGVPLYAAVLWVTWLMVRSVYARRAA